MTNAKVILSNPQVALDLAHQYYHHYNDILAKADMLLNWLNEKDLKSSPLLTVEKE